MSEIDRSYPKRDVKDMAQRPFVQIDAELISSLNPFEFITYAQIKRRAGGSGECWESIDHMAAETSMSRTTLKKAIKVLIAKNLLMKEARRGGTDTYNLTPPEEWRLGEKRIEQCLPEHGRVATEHGRVATTEHGRHATTNKIPFKIDPSNTLTNLKISNADEGTTNKTGGEKSAYAERLKSFSNALESIAPSLADNQTASLLRVDPNPVDREKDSAAPRSMNTDKPHKPEPWGNGYDRQQGNRDRAQSGAWFKSGLVNKRWKDRQDFNKFVAYVEIYAENRRKDPDLNPDGTKYGKDYRIAILSRTASTQDENDSMLACWKTWNLEPVAPIYLEVNSGEVVIVDLVAEAAFQVKFAKLKADNQAKREAVAAEKVRKDEIIRGLHES